MNESTGGRPSYDEKQYEIWLNEIKPFLERGKSLSKSIELAALSTHRTTIYEKYRLKDWFSDKVDTYQRALGEMINDAFVSLIYKINDKVKRGEDLTDVENKQLMFAAEKHRSAQPFFVNRFETARGKPVEEIIDSLEQSESIDDVTEHLEKIQNGTNQPSEQIPAATSFEVLEANASLQDQG